MLSTAKIRNGSWRYYAGQVEHGACEYFLGVGEAPGVWYGRGLDALALTPEAVVAERELEALFGRGLHPNGRQQLGRAWRADGVTGYDLTFSAPKSVSALWALGDDNVVAAIRAAHASAVRAALDYLDTHAAFSRIGRDGRTQIATDGLVVAVFDHRTSRAGDPQMHSHALVLNKVRCVDGEWRTIDGHEIYAHKKSAGALYQSALRNELTRTLGVSWTAVSKDGQAEIAGVPDQLIRAWAKRTAQTLDEAEPVVAAYEHLLGRELSSAERVAVQKVAVVKTRPRKDQVDIVGLHQRWVDEAAALGWTGRRLRAAVSDAVVPVPPREQGLAQVDAAIVTAVTAAGDRRAVFTRSGLAIEIAARIPTVGFTAEMTRELLERLTDRALQTSEAVRLRDATDGPARASDARYASRTTLQRELDILAVAGTGRHDNVAICDPDTIAAAADSRGLDEAQTSAVARLCGDGATVSVLVAPAGTGKTTTLGAAVTAWNTDGHRVLALAPSARAAKELGAATGLRANTVAKFLHEQHLDRDPRDPDWIRYRIVEGDVVIVDEASMLPTADLHTLTRVAWQHGAKLVLVGDPAQIGAIDTAGGMLPALAERLHAPSLDTVHRFREPWERHASLALRDGDPTAIDDYLNHGRIHAPAATDSGGDVLGEMFRHYTRLAIDDRQVLMLTRANVDVDELNARARQHAIATGAVHGESLLTAGDREWRAGDRLRVTRNNRRIPVGADYLRNGDLFTVTGRTTTGLAIQRLDATEVAELPDSYVAEHARYGWACTIAAAQGATVDHALLLARPGLDRSNLYVGLTRGRDSNHLYLADEPHPEIPSTRRRDVDAAQQLRTMLDNHGDHTAAHAQLPESVETPAPTWERRPTREQQRQQFLHPAARPEARVSEMRVGDHRRTSPGRGVER